MAKDNGKGGDTGPDRGERRTTSTDQQSGSVPRAPRGEFRGLLKPFAYIDRGLAIYEAVALSAGVILMAFNSIANVVGRFALGQSLYFSEELNQFLVILITFAGIGFAARHGRHIRMSAFYDMLGDGPRKMLMVFIALVTAAAMFVLAWYSLAYIIGVYETGRIAAATRIPVYITMIWLPLGFLVTGIQYVLTAVANLSRPDVYISASVVDSYDDTETPV